MQFLHYDLGYLSADDVVEVTLTEGANVRLLDSYNFSQYQNGSQHNFYGGLAQQSPVRLPIPHSSVWHVVVDLQGLTNSTNASVRVINSESRRPLPPIPDPIPSPRAQPTIADVINNASSDQDAAGSKDWDVFISHATEDKEAVAGPLAHALQDRGMNVWYDDFELRIGKSLRRSIDDGIARSRFGLVILSESFFAKNWPQYELDGLVTRANSDQQILLPIWHGVSRDDVIAYSAPLADKVALSTSERGIDEIADEIASVIASATATRDDPQTSQGQVQVTISLAPRIVEGAREEAQKQRRDLEGWIAAAVKTALSEPDPLSGGWLGGPQPLGETPISVTVTLLARVHDRAQQMAAADDRTLANWIEALVEKLVRQAELVIWAGGPSYYDGGDKRH